ICMSIVFFLFFFFQAEDGIRDGHVTGVQTCALPISQQLAKEADRVENMGRKDQNQWKVNITVGGPDAKLGPLMDKVHIYTTSKRSEERRVGKECRARRAKNH